MKWEEATVLCSDLTEELTAREHGNGVISTSEDGEGKLNGSCTAMGVDC